MTKVWHGGKGSSQRRVDLQKYNTNFDNIFRKDKQNGTITKETGTEKSTQEPSKKGQDTQPT